MTMEELQIVLQVNNKQLIQGLSEAQSHLKKFQAVTNKTNMGIFNSFKKLGLMVAGLGIGRMVKKSIIDGMDAIESENLFQVAMGGFADQFTAWSDGLQRTLGLNAYEVRKNAALFHMLGTNMGIASETSAGMAKNLTQIAYDMASFRNKEPAQVFHALQSAMVGNTEALRSMGIVLTMADVKQEAYRLGIANLGDELNTTQKAMAIYSSICRQTSLDQGDLARTISTPANQLRILRSQLQQLSIEFGKAFTPILNIVLPALNALVGKLIQVVKVVGQFMQALFGKSGTTSAIGGAAEVSGSLGNIAGGYDNIEKAAKKAKKQLMGFDEVNALNSEEEESSSMPDVSLPGVGDLGSMLPSADDINTDEIPAKVQEMADKVKAVFQGFADWFTKYKDIIISIIAGIAAGFLAFKTLTFLSNIPAILTSVGAAIAGLMTPIGIASIAIGTIVGLFVLFYRTNEEFRDLMNDIWADLQEIWEKFWGRITTAWNEFVEKIKATCSRIKTEIFDPIIGNAIEMLREVWDNHLKGMVESISEFVAKLVAGALEIYNEFIDPIVNWFLDMFGPIIVDAINWVVDTFGTFLGVIADVVKGVFDVLGGLVDFIVGVFTGDWERAWEGIKGIFSGIWDAIKGIFSGFAEFIGNTWETIKEICKKVVTTIKDIVVSIWDNIVEKVTSIVEKMKARMSAIWGAIKYVVHNIVEGIKEKIVNAWEKVKEVTSNVLGKAGEIVGNVFEGIKKSINKVVDFISGGFKDAWSKAWNKVVDVFSNIWDGIKDVVKRPLNFVIDMINKFINGMNRIRIPDWVPVIGGAGVNIPTIPRLARGGIVNKPTLAEIGEAGPEMVVPLKNTDFVNKLANAVGRAVMINMSTLMQTTGTTEPQPIIIQVNDLELGRAAIGSINKVTKMTGECPIRL